MMETDTVPSNEPFIVAPGDLSRNLLDLGADELDNLRRLLHIHGAILLRGFDDLSPERLQVFAEIWCKGPMLVYEERSSPRTLIEGQVYTSSDYSPRHVIRFHSEQSYNTTFPRHLFFWCALPAAKGGETLLADVRRAHDRLAQDLAGSFGNAYRLIRNYNTGRLGMTWQEAFQTSSKHEVEGHCRDNEIACEWVGDSLRTSQVRPLIGRHPISDERVWFNHMAFFNVASLDESVGRLIAKLGVENLPTNTYFVDGSVIAPELIQRIWEAYEEEPLATRWRHNDLLVVDNMLMAHARARYQGSRRLFVTMGTPTRWADTIGN